MKQFLQKLKTSFEIIVSYFQVNESLKYLEYLNIISRPHAHSYSMYLILVSAYVIFLFSLFPRNSLVLRIELMKFYIDYDLLNKYKIDKCMLQYLM